MLLKMILICFSMFVVALDGEFGVSSSDPVEEAKVKGSVSFPGEFDISKLAIVKSRVVLVEEYLPSPLPAPKEFGNWTAQKRSEWYAEWEKTKEGEAYKKKEEARFDALKKYESKIKKDWGFSFEGVNAGDYDLAGELQLQYENRQYTTEFFAKVRVSSVDEVSLKNIKLNLLRSLNIGDLVPSMKDSAGVVVDQSQLMQKCTLVVFWSRTYGIGEQLAKKISDAKNDDRVQVAAIRVGKPPKEGKPKAPSADFNGNAEGINSDICANWGVRGLPSLWLVDRKGKILATPVQLSKSDFNLTELLDQKSK